MGRLSPHTNVLSVQTSDRHVTSTMASSHTDQVILDGARNIPTSEELKEAFAVEVYDRAGDKKHLGDLIDGKISILIFTRHFCEPARHYISTGLIRKGCLNCQAYVRIISEKIPPAKLPSNTQSTSRLPCTLNRYADTLQSSLLEMALTNPLIRMRLPLHLHTLSTQTQHANSTRS